MIAATELSIAYAQATICLTSNRSKTELIRSLLDSYRDLQDPAKGETDCRIFNVFIVVC